MLLRRATGAAAVSLLSKVAVKFSNSFCSVATASSIAEIKHFRKIPPWRRSKGVQELQQSLAEYLHTTRSLPFIYADNIASNSLQSLGKIVSKIRFSRSNLAEAFQQFLRYHPINELDFFFESIGLSCKDNVLPLPPSILPPDTFFISDWKHFDVFCSLARIGFPWNKLGRFCNDETLVSRIDHLELQGIVDRIKDDYGFDNESIISICLVFPRVLYGKMDGLLSHLKTLFLDNDLLKSVDSDMDAIIDLCEKVQMFYDDSGDDMGKLVQFVGRNKSLFLECRKEVMASKISYFCKLAIQKDQICDLLLSRPEIFGFDIENRRISVSGFLKHLGFTNKQLRSLVQMYPHVFGMNRIANLPNILRSLNLNEWFFERLRHGDPFLFGSYTIGSVEELDTSYTKHLSEIGAKRMISYDMKKLHFLHSIGFGENKYAVKVFNNIKGDEKHLQDRFNCLVEYGIEHSKVCTYLRVNAKILNQHKNAILKKLDFLCTDSGFSLDTLDDFPGFLCYNLEKRIIPRYNMLKWTIENGCSVKHYKCSTIIPISKKNFCVLISRIHPAALKKWQEMQ